MKVSICGKGGSGKSTLVALLAREFRRRGTEVLVVDSDESNAGLHTMLGFDGPPTPLMELAGGRKNVRKALGTATAGGGKAEGTSVLARDAIRADAVEHTAAWNGKASAAKLRGRVVRLRLRMRNAKLYAMQFVE